MRVLIAAALALSQASCAETVSQASRSEGRSADADYQAEELQIFGAVIRYLAARGGSQFCVNLTALGKSRRSAANAHEWVADARGRESPGFTGIAAALRNLPWRYGSEARILEAEALAAASGMQGAKEGSQCPRYFTLTLYRPILAGRSHALVSASGGTNCHSWSKLFVARKRGRIWSVTAEDNSSYVGGPPGCTTPLQGIGEPGEQYLLIGLGGDGTGG